MKKLLSSFFALSITVSSANVLVACGSKPADLEVDKNEMNYLMEQYAKAAYVGHENNTNIEWVFQNYVEYQNMGLLNSNVSFDNKYNLKRYDQLFNTYFPKSNFLASDIKYDNFKNSNNKLDGSTDSISTIVNLLSVFLNDFVGTTSGFASFASIVKSLLSLPLIMSQIQTLIAYLGDLLTNDEVQLLQDAFSNDSFANQNLTFDDALHSSYIGFANGINLLTGSETVLDESVTSDDNAYNNGTATTTLMNGISKINLTNTTFDNKVRGIAKAIAFLKTLMVYLNHFWSSSSDVASLRQDKITSSDNKFDLSIFFNLIQQLKTAEDDKSGSAIMSKILAPLFSYTSSDLSLDLTAKNLNSDAFDKDKNIELMKKNGAGLSLAFQQILSNFLGENQNISFKKSILVVSIQLDNLNIPTLLSVLLSTITSNNVIKFKATVFFADVWDFKVLPVINSKIDELITDENIASILKSILKGDQSIFTIIEPEIKTFLNSLQVNSFSLDEKTIIDFNKLSKALGILKDLNLFVSNKPDDYNKWWTQAGLIKKSDGTYDLENDSPLYNLQSFLSDFKGVSKILNKIQVILKNISDQNKKIKTKIESEFALNNFNIKKDTILDFNIKDNSYKFEYEIENEIIDIYIKHYDDGFRIQEIEMNQDNS